MDSEASIEQAAGILLREGFEFETHRNGRSYRVAMDRDAVFIFFDYWSSRLRLRLTSPVLSHLDPEDPGYAVLLNRLNGLNRQHAFAKWFVEAGTLVAAHDLIGDTLQAGELVNAVHSLAAAAEAGGNELEDVTGGLRFDDLLAVAEVGETGDDFYDIIDNDED